MRPPKPRCIFATVVSDVDATMLRADDAVAAAADRRCCDCKKVLVGLDDDDDDDDAAAAAAAVTEETENARDEGMAEMQPNQLIYDASFISTLCFVLFCC